MDGIALVEQAKASGLELWADGGTLRMKGPRRLAALVNLIKANKAEVLAALASLPAVSTAPHFHNTSSGDGNGSGKTPAKNILPSPPISDTQNFSGGDIVSSWWRRFLNLRPLIGGGFPPQPTPEVSAEHRDTRRRCPECGQRFILPELLYLTGDRCWTCAEARQ